MKVLHLIDSGGLYGAEQMLLALVNAQLSMGMEPIILSVGDLGIVEKPIEREAERLGLPIKVWRMVPGLNRQETSKICDWAEQWGVDLVHSHGYKFNILMGLFGRFRKPIPVITTLHGYVHAPIFTRMWVYEVLDRLAISRMKKVVLVGDAMKKELPGNLASSKKISIIRNGISIDEIMTRSRRDLPKDVHQFLQQHNPVILGVGRLSREKGFDLLVSAFREILADYPRAGLLIAGEGTRRSELEALVNEYNISGQTLMPGYCENIPALMARSSVLVISSSTEGLPITLLEALAVQLPVVSTSVGEIPYVLAGGAHGVLVEKVLESRLANAVKGVFEDPESARDRTEGGFKMLCDEFSASAMACQYLKVYEQALML
ncbi:MAG: Glycosyltransferase [Marinobacter excellens HL-55]|uniref:Glycosyltransferase n=1 Tax=Marinobacter excellens HL-55 TaxID=1305731 RepID=A0A0P7YLI1_9GAMM|nr:MAG: Glycosyltransferase [Marinobacter excellens HL-55]